MRSTSTAKSCSSSMNHQMQMQQQKQQKIATIEDIINILKKDASIRNEDELKLLDEWSFLIPEAQAKLKAKLESRSVLKQRSIEQEESFDSIVEKVDKLVKLIRESNYTVLYTGAGISTSASIPDYRGPNGLWTQIRKTGTFSITKIHDLSSAEPTYTHMAVKELCKRKIINHVVSQNCDGLHLRSGIMPQQLSEIHGNMYIEICQTCEKQYYRQADITERTCRFRHKTGRKCHKCPEPNNNLTDTIVLFGERSRTKLPMNWERAGKAAKKADLIICMGSSLKTLRRYSCLWPKRNQQQGVDQATKLVIINLQYTSKDRQAILKLNGKCDLVMQLIMQKLNINVPNYDWSSDPLSKLSVPFTEEERLNLKRNLIFESRIKQKTGDQQQVVKTEVSDHSLALVESNQSPSLFVSEMSSDQSITSLRMRIKVVNSSTVCDDDNDRINDVNSSVTNPGGSFTINSLLGIKEEGDSVLTDNKANHNDSSLKEQLSEQLTGVRANFVLPGWLGKSLGSSRQSSYRRKRHGNKGRKHPSVLKSKQNALEPTLNHQLESNELTDTAIKSQPQQQQPLPRLSEVIKVEAIN